MSDKIRDPRVVNSKFPVWLARDMLFNNPPRYNPKIYAKHTEAEKVKYTKSILAYLDKMEAKPLYDENIGGTAVAIMLDGMVRYVWRSDLLTEKEYDEVKAKQKAGLRVLFKKRRGDVGQDGSDG